VGVLFGVGVRWKEFNCGGGLRCSEMVGCWVKLDLRTIPASVVALTVDSVLVTLTELVGHIEIDIRRAPVGVGCGVEIGVMSAHLAPFCSGAASGDKVSVKPMLDVPSAAGALTCRSPNDVKPSGGAGALT